MLWALEQMMRNGVLERLPVGEQGGRLMLKAMGRQLAKMSEAELQNHLAALRELAHRAMTGEAWEEVEAMEVEAQKEKITA